MKSQIDHILSEYKFLIPRRDYTAIIALLQERINQGEIEEVFTYEDVEECVYKFKGDQSLQLEKAFQYLLTYFLRKDKGQPNRYFLTQYAKNFITLISEKIESPYRNLPLKQNFEKYFQLKKEDIHSIDDLKSWYEFGFNKIARNIVSQHIESLYDELEKATIDLSNILHAENLNALELVKKFSLVFKTFGKRSKEIREVLNLKNSVLLNLKKISDTFYSELDSITPRERKSDPTHFKKVSSDWDITRNIISEVKLFFVQVDVRLDYISYQILFASKKLDELNENFEKQALLKINLKKMMRLALEDASRDNHHIVFNRFPLKKIPSQDLRLNAPKKYPFDVETDNPIILNNVDLEYEKEQRESLFQALNVQERTSIWIDNLKQKLESDSSLELTNEFFNILSQEENIEIPLNVSFDLINQSRHNTKTDLKIEQTVNSENENSNVSLWKMSLKNK